MPVEELDRLVATGVHEYLGFPFHFNSSLLYLPFSHLGFGFPSLAHLNDVAAVQGMLRVRTIKTAGPRRTGGTRADADARRAAPARLPPRAGRRARAGSGPV